MVRASLLMSMVLISIAGSGQSLMFGFRLGTGVASSVQLGAPREYYFAAYNAPASGSLSNSTSDRYIRTSGKGMVELDGFMPPEVYFRYQSKNRFFLQAAAAFVASLQTTFYGYDPDVEEQYNPSGRWDKETFYGVVPADHQGARVLYFMPNVTANYYLTKGTVIKPFLGVGVSPSFMQSNRVMSGPDPDEIGPTEAIIYKDFGPRKSVVLNGKVVAGFQFYALHVEASMYSNITPIASGSDPYHERISTVYLSIGYNLLNFNLAKKSRP